MEHMVWHRAYESGLQAMDETHREFVALINEVIIAPEASLATAFASLVAHTRSHFEEEDSWMRDNDYASAGCHLDEHKAVLASLEEVGGMLEAGDSGHVRSVAQALADWFPEHAEAMDLGLARWLFQRRLGGSPVMFNPRHPTRKNARASYRFIQSNFQQPQ